MVFGSVMPKILYWFLSRLVHYRRRVIDDNLLNAGIANLENVVVIRNAYYKQLANYVVESVYGLYAPFAKLEQKIRFINIGLLESFLADGRNVIIVASHFGNWEWAVPMLAKVSKYPVVGVYKPISDKALDAVMLERRSRFGLIMASMGEVVRHIKTSKVATAYVLIADQSPAQADPACMADFFGIPTYFVSGPQKLSNRFDMVVLNQTIKPVSGGYEVVFTALNAADLPEVYAQSLESDIRAQPAYWLWSHKRWKLNTAQKSL